MKIGVGFVLRKTAASVKPTMIIKRNGNQWQIQVNTAVKNQEVNFTEGEFIKDDYSIYKLISF